MNFLRKYFFHSPVSYGIALGLNAFLVLIVLCLKGFDRQISYVDAFSVAGFVSILFGLLLWMSAAGAFSTFGYAFSTFRAERRYKDLYEYTTAKQEKRSKHKKTYIPYIVVGVIFFAVSVMISKITGISLV